MCLICTDLKRNAITLSEAVDNFEEMRDELPIDHAFSVIDLLLDKALEEEIDDARRASRSKSND